MSDTEGIQIVQQYRDNLYKQHPNLKARVIITVSVICAETNEEAEEIALSQYMWSIQKEKGEGKSGVPSIREAKRYLFNEADEKKIDELRSKLIIGNPKQVKSKLEEVQYKYKADEIMIVTITGDYEDRLRSYELIGKEMLR